MLKLRRGRVVSVEAGERVAKLSVALDDDQGPRSAIAYPALTGPVEIGDEVVVNVEAQDLGLGSGGFDIVCINLTRGLAGEATEGAHVMKLNYTPIQHAVMPIEEGLDELRTDLRLPVSVLALHGQLPAAAFATSSWTRRPRVGYIQVAGGALPGQLSNVVGDLIEREMLAGHVTVSPCFGGPLEAITLEGALHAAVARLGWEGAFIGPGPGILGSASGFGHGGLAALHAARSALALGCDVIVAPRISSGDQRERHRGVSHHTRAVLELLDRTVAVPLPNGITIETQTELEQLLSSRGHLGVEVWVDGYLEPFSESGLPTETMRRSLEDDEDFFRGALAAGELLAQRIGDRT
jgi:uncharacterized protein DUF3866